MKRPPHFADDGTDDGRFAIVESLANDEWRGTWVNSISDNVDKLYLNLPGMKKGLHLVTFRVIDRYFALSRFVIYTKERAENNLGINCACPVSRRFPDISAQALPQTGQVLDWADSFYGEIPLKPRKEIFANRKVAGDSTLVTDFFVESEHYARTKRPKEILSAANGPFCERDGAIKIDAVTAYAQTEFAYAKNDRWQYCGSESYGRSGLAMYIRKRGQEWKQQELAPSLNYQVKCEGGEYDLWGLLRIDPASPSPLGLAIDGVFVERSSLYNGGKTWRYEAEQVWRWLPLASVTLTGGGI